MSHQADSKKNKQAQKQYCVRKSADSLKTVKQWCSHHYRHCWNQEAAEAQQKLTAHSQSDCKNQLLQVHCSDVQSAHVCTWLQQARHCNQKAARSESAFLRQSEILACLLIQKSDQIDQVSLSSNCRCDHISISQFINWWQTALLQWAQELWALSW